jgi:hypothetical protein
MLDTHSSPRLLAHSIHLLPSGVGAKRVNRAGLNRSRPRAPPIQILPCESIITALVALDDRPCSRAKTSGSAPD